MPKAPRGVVLYDGPSLIDGAPIIAIATFATSNVKTGAMVQTWIVRKDVKPTEALKTGDDASVCGGCKHRPINGGSCYVTVFQAPRAVHDGFRRGIYPTFNETDHGALFAGRALRLGSYGDPAAVPFDVWQGVVKLAASHTGYTHQWVTMADPRLALLCMASADTPLERLAAKAAGWRTFRVRLEGEPLDKREIVCPASEEAGNRTTCADCRACGGFGARAKVDIAIVAHGAPAKVKAFARKVA